jgi:hypothetical protein
VVCEALSDCHEEIGMLTSRLHTTLPSDLAFRAIRAFGDESDIELSRIGFWAYST